MMWCIDQSLRLQKIREVGHFIGLRITIVDPDDPSGRTKNIYEDLDEEIGKERSALITLFPERSRAQSIGDTISGLVVTTHAKAVLDLVRMIEKFGYTLTIIEKDVRWLHSSDQADSSDS